MNASGHDNRIDLTIHLKRIPFSRTRARGRSFGAFAAIALKIPPLNGERRNVVTRFSIRWRNIEIAFRRVAAGD